MEHRRRRTSAEGVRAFGTLQHVVLPFGILADELLETVDAVCQHADCYSVSPSRVGASFAARLPYGCPYAPRKTTGQHVPYCLPGTVSENDVAPAPSTPRVFSHIGAPAPITPRVFSLFSMLKTGAPSCSTQLHGASDTKDNRLAWFGECLRDLSNHMEGVSRIAFPYRIGCGHGGGSWRKYRSQLEVFAAQHPHVEVMVVRTTSSFVQEHNPERALCSASRKAHRLLAKCRNPETRLIGEQLLSDLDSRIREAMCKEEGEQPAVVSQPAYAHAFTARVEDLNEEQRNLRDAMHRSLRAAREAEDAQYQEYLACQLRSGLLTEEVLVASRDVSALVADGSPVDLPDSGFRAQFEEPLAAVVSVPHRRVRLYGLRKQPSLNGRLGLVVGFRQADERYVIDLDGSDKAKACTVNCKGTNLVDPLLTADCAAADSRAPAITVSSAEGLQAPARLKRMNMVDSEDRLVQVACNILDSGSAITLAFEQEIARLEALHPSMVRRVEPLESSIRRIRGIGAVNNVLYWVAFTLDLGGVRVYFRDVPVLPGNQGILLGNDFIGKGRVQWSYGRGVHGGTEADGFIVLRDQGGLVLSEAIPFEHGPQIVHTSAAVEGVVDANIVDLDESCPPAPPEVRVRLVLRPNGTGVDTSLFVRQPLTEEAIADAVKGAVPLAYAPRTIVVPRRSERFIRLRCPAQVTAGHDVAILPLEDERAEDLGLLLAPTLQTVDARGYVTARVINMSNEEVRIPQLRPMARFVIDPREYVESLEFSTQQVMDSCHIDPCHDEAARALIGKMLSKRRRLFRSELGRAYAHGYKMKLSMPRVESGEVPAPCDNIRPLPPKELAALEEAVTKQLRMGLIEPSTSAFRARPLMIPKATGGWRVVLDYRRCNELLVKDTYPLPTVDQRLNALGKANWFSTVDLLMGFHQVELQEGFSKEATAFGTPFGNFQYVRAPMGLATSPATFVRLVDAVLRGLPADICQAYVDDLIVSTSGSLEKHLEDVGKVLDRLIEGGFTVRADKVHLAMRETPFLGFIAGFGGTRPDPEKTRPLLDLTLEQLGHDPAAAARFAGMLGVYHQFLPDLHMLREPFDQLRSKGMDPKEARERMTSLSFRAAFVASKHALANVAARARPDFNKRFYVDIDTATSMGIGGVLSQRVDDADESSHKPLGFLSRRFLDAERRYGVRDQECLGILEALRHWRPIILGCRVTVRTDHQSLKWLMRTSHTNGSRVAGYAMEAQEFDPDMEWVPGKLHVAPDCLSRMIPEGEPPKGRVPIADRVFEASSLSAMVASPSEQSFVRCPLTAEPALIEQLEDQRSSTRVAGLIVRQNVDGVQVLLQNIGGVWGAVEAGVDLTTRVSYREQFCGALDLRYGAHVAALTKVIRGKCGRNQTRIHSRGMKETHFVSCVVPAEFELNTEALPCFAFEELTSLRVGSLVHKDDFDVLRLLKRRLEDCYYASVGQQPRHGYDVSSICRLLERSTVVCATAGVTEFEATSTRCVPRFQDVGTAEPSFCVTSSEAAGGSTALWGTILSQPADSRCVAIDLEGKLGGSFPHISLLQASADDEQVPAQDTTLVYDTHANGYRIFAQRAEHSLVPMLEDPSIVKVFHCCSGDLHALWSEYQVAASGVFDTGVADCLLRGSRMNQLRGLDDVLYAWLGKDVVQLTYKGKLHFTPGLFDERPLPYHLFVYAYQDVTYCCRLYRAMRALLAERCLEQLCYAVSATRAPAACRPVADTAVVAVHDATHVLVLRDLRTGLLELPSGLVPGGVVPSRESAQEMWEQLLGLPPPPLRKLWSKLRKVQCLGRWALYPCPIGNCQGCLEAVAAAAIEGGALVGHELVAMPLYLRDCFHLRTEQWCLFQCLHFEAYRRSSSIERGPIASVYSIAVDVCAARPECELHVTAATVVVDGCVRLGLCNVVLGKTLEGNQRAALVVHDASHVYLLVDAAGHFVFPSHPLEIGEEPLECALKGFDQYAGGVRHGGVVMRRTAFAPHLQKAFYDSRAGIVQLEPPAPRAYGNTTYFDYRLNGASELDGAPQAWRLSDSLCTFQAARQPKYGWSLTATFSKRYPAWAVVTFAQARKRMVSSQELSVLEAVVARAANSQTDVKLNTASVAVGHALPVSVELNTASGVSENEEDDALFQATVCVAFGKLVSRLSTAESEGPTVASATVSVGPVRQEVTLAELAGAAEFSDTAQCLAAAVRPPAHPCSPGEAEAFPVGVDKALARCDGIGPVKHALLTNERLLSAQLEHPGLRQLLSFLVEGELSQGWRSLDETGRADLSWRAADCCLQPETGLLMRLHPSDKQDTAGAVSRARVFAPPACFPEIFRMYHDRMGHFGCGRCFPLIVARYYWDTQKAMRSELQQYINRCPVCQRSKLLRHIPGEYQTDEIGRHPWDIVAMDEFDVGEALHIDGYTGTMDFGDLFGRAVSSNAIGKGLTSEGVAQLFVDQVVRHHGKPSQVRVDRASVLIARAIKHMYQRFGVELKAGAAYQHKMVAFVERWHQTLLQLLDAFRMGTGEKRWYLYLSLLEFAFNTTVNATTGYSPFFVDHLREAVLPYDTHSPPPAGSEELPEWVEQYLKRRSITYDAVTHTLRTGMLARKKVYDLKHDVTLKFRVGDRVLRLAGTKKDAKAVHPKATDFWLGPCTVEAVLPFDDYDLRECRSGKEYKQVHVSRLKWSPLPRTEEQVRSLECCPVASLVDRRVRYTVEGVVVLYRVRWSRLSSLADEWRERAYLSDVADMVAAYDEAYPLPEGLITEDLVARAAQPFTTPNVAKEALERPRFQARPPASVDASKAPETPPKAPVAPPQSAELADEVSDADTPSRQQLEELQSGWLADGSRVQVHYPYDEHSCEWHAGSIASTKVSVPRKVGNPHKLKIVVRWDKPLDGDKKEYEFWYGGPYYMRPMRTRQPPIVKEKRPQVLSWTTPGN